MGREGTCRGTSAKLPGAKRRRPSPPFGLQSLKQKDKKRKEKVQRRLMEGVGTPFFPFEGAGVTFLLFFGPKHTLVRDICFVATRASVVAQSVNKASSCP